MLQGGEIAVIEYSVALMLFTAAVDTTATWEGGGLTGTQLCFCQYAVNWLINHENLRNFR